ncbi:prepilin-type N-terminal cleavage/methylation domain-containing protein [Patescibacteria group bacterium]|nr:prepilin-type N-terminal cleavage/methylation domain-containing protein [Patescibacteria group bacterium]
MNNKKGFTLIEILLVIVIIAVLAGIVLIAVNPARQVSQANDAQRRSDVNSILNAIHQYAIDNRGALPSSITTSAQTMGSSVGQANICSNLVPTYIAALPYDPTASGSGYTDCASYNTGYTVIKDANNRITVNAASAEVDSISVTR